MTVSYKDTETWTGAFDSGLQRRMREIPKKLQKLGLARIANNESVLDLCCGRCESLIVLRERGFERLSGIDMAIAPSLQNDPRFQLIAGDATNAPFPSESQDWILNLHALHHLGNAENVARLVDSAYRMLKPGGRLSVIDFPDSPQIRLAFWLFRKPYLWFTPYLRYYGTLVIEEWPYLKDYLPIFKSVRKALMDPRFEVEIYRQELFLFFLTLRKPGGATRGN